MILKATYFNPSEKNVNLLIDYLYSIGGRKLKVTGIRRIIFQTKNIFKNNNHLNREHIQASAIYLNHLMNMGDDIDYKEGVKTTIADICPIIQNLDPNEDCSFIICSPNSLPTLLHYKQAEWLFYKNCLPKETKDRYHIDLMVLYVLRLSLEKRILGLLGIENIQVEGRPVNLSKILPMTAKLKSIEFDPKINWEEIRLVNEWLNHFMHRHLRPYPWALHQAFEVLNPILSPGKVLDNKRIYFSHYASTFVKSENNLEAEIESNFKAKIPGIKIIWSGHREILLAKSNV